MVIKSSDIKAAYYQGNEAIAMYKGKALIWKKNEYHGFIVSYDVTSKSSATTILYSTTNIDSILWLDNDTAITPATAYTFPTTGAVALLVTPVGSGIGILYRRFYGCTQLTHYKHAGIDTSAVKNFSYMFYGCTALESVNEIDTSAATTCEYMFYNCKRLDTIPTLETPKCTLFTSMFYGCTLITTIPTLNTSAGTSFASMFRGCTALTSVPQLDTARGTNFYSMFYGCTALASIPSINTAKNTNFGHMFRGCTSLTAATTLDTAEGTNFNYMFYGCTKLVSVSLDLRNASSLTSIFSGCTAITTALLSYIGQNSALTTADLSGLTVWGQGSGSVSLHRSIALLYDRATAGYDTCTLKLSSATKALLSDSEISQITAKGFTLS
jgi:hypothetical protein